MPVLDDPWRHAIVQVPEVGDISVRAFPTCEAGLICFPDPVERDMWYVAHELSGAPIFRSGDPEHAQYVASQFGALADWTLDFEQLRDSDLPRQMRDLTERLGLGFAGHANATGTKRNDVGPALR